jgi:hypothetical protein
MPWPTSFGRRTDVSSKTLTNDHEEPVEPTQVVGWLSQRAP